MKSLPECSILRLTPFDYIDSYQGTCIVDPSDKIDIQLVARAFFMSSPGWVDRLFALRNSIAAKIGLKTGGPVVDREKEINEFRGEVGDQLGLFQVYERTEDEMILGENDRHLDFRVSLLILRGPDQKSVAISTGVTFHSAFGRLYFLLVPRATSFPGSEYRMGRLLA